VSFSLSITLAAERGAAGQHANVSGALAGFIQDQEAGCLLRALVRPPPLSPIALSLDFSRLLPQLCLSKHKRRSRRRVGGNARHSLKSGTTEKALRLTLPAQFTAQHWSSFMSNALFGSSRIVGIAAAYANQVSPDHHDYEPHFTSLLTASAGLLSSRRPHWTVSRHSSTRIP
jgi:hypothetical protein